LQKNQMLMKNELNILMLEDDLHDAKKMTDELSRGDLPFHIHRVRTQNDLAATLTTDPPDLILSGHGLPGLSGLEALALARQIFPEVPAVLVAHGAGSKHEMKVLAPEPVKVVSQTELSRLVPVIHEALQHTEKPKPAPNRAARRSADDEVFRTLVEEVTHYAICRLDETGRVISWNAGIQWIQGYEAHEIIGKHFSCFYPDHAVEKDEPGQALAGALTQGRFHAESIMVRKGGQPFWAEVVISPLSVAADGAHGFSLVVSDITARKQTEAERERLIQELQATLNNVKILSGLLPICASCKKVRDYEGRWHPLESYLRNHSEATLSHEFCEDCASIIQPAAAQV